MSADDRTLALFAASFDPVTNGHLDLIERAHELFPRLVVAVGTNVAKSGTFTLEERLEMLRVSLQHLPDATVTSFEGLLVDYAEEIGARVLIRGLRQMADFEYEFEMALMNKSLRGDIETMFMMTSQNFFYVSSSRLKELASFGTDISEWVPEIVRKMLQERLGPR